MSIYLTANQAYSTFQFDKKGRLFFYTPSYIGKLAVKTGIWPLKEYVDGKVNHTKKPYVRVPVEDYLLTQARFNHLFEPIRNDKLINEIQSKVDAYWADVT